MKLRVGGVPEHYNLPWHWAWENQLNYPSQVQFEWKSYPAGTGAMLKDLHEGKLDLAILLTEGTVKDIGLGNPIRIIGFHVDSPLRWGIHTGKNSRYHSLDEAHESRFAISRYKSGSHLMARVLASRWDRIPDDDTDFVLVENLEGARQALSDQPDLLFLWERFTTKHLVDSGEFRYLGDCFTPWPSFVVAARLDVLGEREEEVQHLLGHVNAICRELTGRKDILDILSRKYRMNREEAAEWYAALRWNAGEEYNETQLLGILHELSRFGLADRHCSLNEIFRFLKPIEQDR